MKLFDTQLFTRNRFAFFLPIVFCCQLFSSSGQVTVPSSNPNDSSSEQPLGCFYGYERTEGLYLSSEIGTTGTITQVGFYVNSLNNPSLSTPVVIKMKTTSATTVSSDTYANASAGATTVWSGNITSAMLSANSWVTITLGTPFNYSSNHLEVFVETNFGGYGDESTSTAKQFRQGDTTVNLCQIWYDDVAPPADLGVPILFRPNIRLTFATACSGTPNPGNTLADMDTVCSGSSFTLSFQNSQWIEYPRRNQCNIYRQ
jgi:hypothetical protein